MMRCMLAFKLWEMSARYASWYTRNYFPKLMRTLGISLTKNKEAQQTNSPQRFAFRKWMFHSCKVCRIFTIWLPLFFFTYFIIEVVVINTNSNYSPSTVSIQETASSPLQNAAVPSEVQLFQGTLKAWTVLLKIEEEANGVMSGHCETVWSWNTSHLTLQRLVMVGRCFLQGQYCIVLLQHTMPLLQSIVVAFSSTSQLLSWARVYTRTYVLCTRSPSSYVVLGLLESRVYVFQSIAKYINTICNITCCLCKTTWPLREGVSSVTTRLLNIMC